MMKILTWPDPRLRQKAAEVEVIDDQFYALVVELFEMMYREGGVGLAATQVGIPLRFFVMDCSAKEPEPLLLINPRILSREGQLFWEEGCLSFPGIRAEVERAEQIRVEALDLQGQSFQLEAEGLIAVCIQHEMDHLEGRVFPDHLGALERAALLREYGKIDET